MTTLAFPDKPVPPSHLGLFTAGIAGVLTTLMPDGQPHSCLVRVDHDGRCARVNTTLERRSGRNLLANPAVSLLVVDPDDTTRYIQLRGTAEPIREGATDHLGALARPGEPRHRDTRVIVRVHPKRITTDAIHS